MFSFEFKDFLYFIVKIFLCRYDGKFVDVFWEYVYFFFLGNGFYNIFYLMDFLYSLFFMSVLNEIVFN